MPRKASRQSIKADGIDQKERAAGSAAEAGNIPREFSRERKKRPPYVELIQKKGGLQIWVVDGSYVRKNIAEEFSNFGHHYTYKQIPKDELWIDLIHSPAEYRFYIAHMMVERRLMARGVSYEEARKAANKQERKMRLRTADVREVMREDLPPNPEVVHERLWKKLSNGLEVWYVKGRLVRSAYDVEFTQGGHEHVYEFVPRNEIWIDNDVHEDERPFVVYHELHERNLMAKGKDYDTAHEESSKRERYYRAHPAELHEALAEEGWE